MAGYDPYAADEAGLARKQKMADLLSGQAMQPIEQFGSGGIPAPISPAAGLAKVLQAWGSRRKSGQVDEGTAALNQRKGADTTADYSDLAAAMRRQPVAGSQPVSDETGTVTHPYVPDQPGGMSMADVAKMRTAEGRAAGMGQFNDQQSRNQAVDLAVLKSGEPPSGYRRGANGLEAIPGGPADLKTISAEADARNPFVLQQVYNPGTKAMDTIAVPRDQIGQGGGVVAQGKPPAPTIDETKRTTLATDGRNALGPAAAAIVGPDGKVNRELVATLAVNFPGSQGRAVRAQLETALSNMLYIKSGAQAGPAEMSNAARQYMPSPLDNDETVKQKLMALASFFDQVAPGKGAVAPAAPAAATATPPPAQSGGYTVRRVN